MNLLVLTFFIAAACLGLFLISYVLRNKNTPKGVAFIHGGIAAFGILLLILYACSVQFSLYIGISLLMFICAACGGFLLMAFDLGGKNIPKSLALGHGLLALSALILLFVLLAP